MKKRRRRSRRRRSRRRRRSGEGGCLRKKACVLHTFFKVCGKSPIQTHSRDARPHFFFPFSCIRVCQFYPHVKPFLLPAPPQSERSADSAQFVNTFERHGRVSVGLPHSFVCKMPSTWTTRLRLMKPLPINNSSQLLPDRLYRRLAWGRESQ